MIFLWIVSGGAVNAKPQRIEFASASAFGG